MLRHFLTHVNESNVYVLSCDETREAALIDAGELTTEVVAHLERVSLTLTAVFITHDHYDHTEGLGEAVLRYGCEVWAGCDRVNRLETVLLQHGDQVRVGRLTGRVIATPGHTTDSISLAIDDRVFTGDALFAGSVGGTRSQAAASQQIDALRRHVLSLPDSTRVHPGHGPSSTVSIERRFNPFLQG